MKKINKAFYALAILFAISILLFTSCSTSHPVLQRNNLPQYVKDFSSIFSKKDIKISYDPIEVKPASPPDKPYPVHKRTIPENWIDGELRWYVGKPTNPTDFLETSIVEFKGDFILESTVDRNFKAPPSHPKAKKPIYKLYKRKNLNAPLPKTITNSDFELIKTLDKEEEQGVLPQNQLAELSDKFVIWSSASFEFTQEWTIWGYDITNDTIFEIYSHNDAEKDFEPIEIPHYNIIEEENILIIDITGDDKEGQLKNKIIFYDLEKRKIAKEFESNSYKRQYLRSWWDPPSLYSINGYLYGERFYLDNSKNILNEYILSDIIKVNLTTFEEETVIERSPFRLVSTSSDGKLSLVPYVKNGLCHDIWIWDIKENKISCLEKICYSEAHSLPPETSSDIPSAPPEISLCNKGIQYSYREERTSEECVTFYSYKEKRVYYDYDSLGEYIDMEGRFLMYKSPYALFNPPPPFDYPGKEDILKGYQTFLIVKPE
ncbi:MAG: hypothetical protein K6343_02590 [Caldisericaceae bacterium]